MFVDIHHHLIYGVDDGSRTFEATQALVREAWADGIRHLITTPHITPGEVLFPYEDYKERLEQTRAWCTQEGLDIHLYEGAEILYTAQTPRLLREGKVPTLAGSRYVLLEFSPDDPYAHILDAVRKVGGAGFVPVIAHAERYASIKKIAQLNDLRGNYGARVQVNARTLLRKHSFFRARWLKKMFEEGMVDYVSTDSHDMPHRHTCMKEAYEKLCQDFGEDVARRLLIENAKEILP